MRVFILLLTGVCIVSCHTKPEQLIWSDEFDGSGQPDTAFWNFAFGNGCPDLCGWGNNEEEFYTDESRNIRIEDGLLIVEAIKLDSIWTSARISTKGKKNFKYGRIEFRAKLPTGKGTWPALWMLGEKVSELGWPVAGEIDVMEHVGRRPGVIQCSLHTNSSFGKTINTDSTMVKTYDTEFHTYSVTWNEGQIEAYVDDEKYYTYKPKEKNPDTWPFDEPFYILINLAIGGNFGGPVDESLTRARLEVDYVRVYQ